MKHLAPVSMLFGLIVAVSVPAMAQKLPPVTPPGDCELKVGCGGPGKDGLGAEKTKSGLIVHTPNGSIIINQTTSPPTVIRDFDCDPLEMFCEELP